MGWPKLPQSFSNRLIKFALPPVIKILRNFGLLSIWRRMTESNPLSSNLRLHLILTTTKNVNNTRFYTCKWHHKVRIASLPTRVEWAVIHSLPGLGISALPPYYRGCSESRITSNCPTQTSSLLQPEIQITLLTGRKNPASFQIPPSFHYSSDSLSHHFIFALSTRSWKTQSI